MSEPTLRQCAKILEGGRWFSSLPEAFREQMLAVAVTKKLAKGEWLFARGDEVDGLYAVCEGAIRVTGTADSGKDALLTFMEPPLWFGEMSILDRGPRTHDAIAEEESVVVLVPIAGLDAIFAREPAWWRHLGVLVAAKMRLLFEIIEDTTTLPIATRIARRLVLAAERYGEWKGKSSKVVDFKQEHLAKILSTSRQTVNQTLKELEGRGLVRISYGNVEILDLDGLRAAANVTEK